ncbi:hypothetical protein [Paracraurococcus lichenis]|uniref:AbrB/MazE/SpoVT family DNA-binding domain-containing protein n=1 Tax=Paracraurococcus lichenis TaxID=3064888 RepID=A0ABT9E5A9_9PROT|nr:hypothetical protein [Paracraurococcus sp. LOR1-02]MDO9711354.1 hypothetical protein [Paracraurococcus sp. LOR1-02]
MIIRVSPQWQVTIPKPFRRAFAHTRRVEARPEDGGLMLRPILADSVTTAAEMFGPEGVTQQVLVEALRIVERRRRRAAEATRPEDDTL